VDTPEGYKLVLITLSRAKGTTMTTREYAVTGMSCSHCEHAITEEVSGVAGVASIEVSSATGRLVVTGEDPIDDGAVLAAVEEAGYEAVLV
jgi:copper chaperone CopZ